MERNYQFNIRLPNDWLEEISKAAELEQCSKAEWIREAIKAQFSASKQRQLSAIKVGRPGGQQ